MYITFVVLATFNDIPILRRVLSRPLIPRLLSPTIRAPTRRILWSISRTLLVAPAVRDDLAHSNVTTCIDAIPRPPAILDAGIYLGPTQPKHSAKLPGPARLHSSIPALGADGLQPRDAREHSQG